MKIQIENLKAKMIGRDLNLYQKVNALIEFNKLLNYVDELEQLTIHSVVKTFPNRQEIDLEARKYACVNDDINCYDLKEKRAFEIGYTFAIKHFKTTK